MEYATRGGFCGFGPQNTGGGSKEEWTARGGIKEFASRRSYLMRGAVAARWKTMSSWTRMPLCLASSLQNI